MDYLTSKPTEFFVQASNDSFKDFSDAKDKNLPEEKAVEQENLANDQSVRYANVKFSLGITRNKSTNLKNQKKSQRKIKNQITWIKKATRKKKTQ